MRLFVAIELNDVVRAALARVQKSLADSCPGVRWVRPELLHLTVKFLGEVPGGQVMEVVQAVEQAGAACEPFDLAASVCGCFPERGSVRVVWAGHPQANTRLAACVEAVEGQMAAIGFPREGRAFSPHITLGRVNEDRSRGEIRKKVAAAKMEPVAQIVRSFTLMSSVLGRGGPSYSAVSKSKFGEPPSGSQES